ncbi:phosphoglycolate phosphatase [Archaeoglobus sulfaticallidus PM70-1]|uniref:Phosphoglycolate phosphatase n=1 Tax=Archaeoglobus sulfaticallidus PM70-1 TaxID=387631 RepID=N0BDS1_9EURY|nr:phosphoglycolate phosphatase [Archaeoglobus sulfaticallidus]AGK61153.1 phosphoglycolate phosphatase [Archaeoglobus sulfaticallidus PM70-1]
MTFDVQGVAIDIDGTITYKDRSLNCRAVEAIRKLKVPVVLATGNISCYARTTAKLIGASDIVICENGGVVRFEYDGEDIVLGDIAKCLKAVEILGNHFDIEILDSEYRKSEVCLRRNFGLEEGKKILKEAGLEGVKLIDSGFAYHITDANVGKGKALKYICDELGIPVEKFVAIGDSENDIDLIEIAGIGVAVANADIKLKERADIVVSRKNGDGVVEAFEFLNLI